MEWKPRLGKTPLQRHLAAFKTDLVIAAGSRVLALMAAPTGLAKPRTNPAPDPLFGWAAAGGGL
jgi:hypothetical protein